MAPSACCGLAASIRKISLVGASQNHRWLSVEQDYQDRNSACRSALLLYLAVRAIALNTT
jgi:hypothetical protein